jgi:hypothetical protein
VEQQVPVGDLLRIQKGAMRQKADYFWRHSSSCWIGDAKYKHLAKGHSQALRFSDLEEPSNEADDPERLAGQILSADDVRQLKVYSELVRRGDQLAEAPELMLLYPFVGPEPECVADRDSTWNGSKFWLMPVLVKAQTSVGDAIRCPSLEGAHSRGREQDKKVRFKPLDRATPSLFNL